MAKTEPAAEAAPATEAAPKVDTRSISATVPATPVHPYTAESFAEALKGDTKSQKRAEFIREYWATKNYDRSTLTALTRLATGNPDLKYQIIFQATKGHEGGAPAKVAAPVAEAEPAAA